MGHNGLVSELNVLCYLLRSFCHFVDLLPKTLCKMLQHTTAVMCIVCLHSAEKVLSELLQPISYRLNSVHQFVTDIKPSLQYNIVPITDPFGPAVTDPQLECIVVSSETVRGANSINVRRAEQVQ